jgi:hypothetical protein
MAEFSRVHVELINDKRVLAIYDFAYGEYIATKSFFDLLSDVQTGLI